MPELSELETKNCQCVPGAKCAILPVRFRETLRNLDITPLVQSSNLLTREDKISALDEIERKIKNGGAANTDEHIKKEYGEHSRFFVCPRRNDKSVVLIESISVTDMVRHEMQRAGLPETDGSKFGWCQNREGGQVYYIGSKKDGWSPVVCYHDNPASKSLVRRRIAEAVKTVRRESAARRTANEPGK